MEAVEIVPKWFKDKIRIEEPKRSDKTWLIIYIAVNLNDEPMPMVLYAILGKQGFNYAAKKLYRTYSNFCHGRKII